ncbi:M16 family metallopeptidase [Amniculibacterium aquaticum]|uniref:M16 family metallopeptidase n=1 Tax=Amniculibacterium aquaticum TaxID=2479858 RepID=UPI000F595C27|nr:M16 family metallopeptidase [Amniculibacterium aquaticum]
MSENKNYTIEKHTDPNGYAYTTVSNDENGVRTYLLKNGLTVFLAQNFDAPKIQTYIPVKTGSNNDPADNTGLAHYLEHMMFKGTSKIATADWEKEKPLLDQLSDLFEVHKKEENPEKKKEIYKEIDAVSYEASTYAIANEYDKIITSIGATNTNAHTWLDETVYKNNIPNYELERWLMIEKERFSEITLRLFHTELEAVYEEFNRAQDNDSRLTNYALMEALFPTHPNGQQTTLGKAEHLKNPSMKAIHKYFDDFYVPNNYAMVLVGDLDFEKTIALVDRYFGSFEYKELPKKVKIEEKPQTEIIKKTVKTPTNPRLHLGWRTDSYGSREAMLADVVANILTNKGEAGLLDININQTQKALWAQAYSVGFKQYGYFSAVIIPKENQSLDEGKELLLNQIERIKKGEFSEDLLQAIINDFKTQRIKSWETADGLATTLYDTYIKGRTWEDELNEIPQYESISHQEIVEFAHRFFKNNFVEVHKEKATNDQLIRVDNPGITPVKINREGKSDFAKKIATFKTEIAKPEYIDYQKAIEEEEIAGKKFSFVQNQYNRIAQLHYIFPIGTDHDKELLLSTQYLQYLGTDCFSPEALRQEFYKLGITNDFRTSNNQLYIILTGLEENLCAGAELLQHWLDNAIADQEVYNDFVQTVFESRAYAKKDKTRIMSALVNYTKYGKNSRLREVISHEDLQNIDVEKLIEKMRTIFQHPYEIFYYGTEPEIMKKHVTNYIKKEKFGIPTAKKFPEPKTEDKVFFVNYDMVQMEMSRVAKAKTVNPENFGKINVYNEYFGRGLSSIVFQEMRESKSLAYSTYVSYMAAMEKENSDYISTYIGTQPDKLHIAVQTLNELMAELPQIPIQFENAKNSVLRQIESGRIVRTQVFLNFRSLNKLGIYHDFRENMYREVEQLDLEQLTTFYQDEIQHLTYNTAIIGKRENLDPDIIKPLGELTELSLEEIFGY